MVVDALEIAITGVVDTLIRACKLAGIEYDRWDRNWVIWNSYIDVGFFIARYTWLWAWVYYVGHFA